MPEVNDRIASEQKSVNGKTSSKDLMHDLVDRTGTVLGPYKPE